MINMKLTLANIGEILERNPSTLRTHINRGFVTAWGPRNIEGDKPAGKHSRFSFFSLMEFAVAYQLADADLSLDRAFHYAGQFAHVGDSDFNALSKSDKPPERFPGLPFHHKHGSTVIAMMGGQSASFANDGECGLAVMKRRLRRLIGNSGLNETMHIFDASAVFADVCKRLNLAPREVLDEAYKGDE